MKMVYVRHVHVYMSRFEALKVRTWHDLTHMQRLILALSIAISGDYAMQAAHGLLCGSHQHRSSYTEVQPMADPRASTFEQFQMVQQLEEAKSCGIGPLWATKAKPQC